MPWRSPDFFERTDMSADPLSDVLSLLQPSSQFFAGFDAAGDWAFDFPAHEGIKFTAVMGGGCWGRVCGCSSRGRLLWRGGESSESITLFLVPTICLLVGDTYLSERRSIAGDSDRCLGESARDSERPYFLLRRPPGSVTRDT